MKKNIFVKALALFLLMFVNVNAQTWEAVGDATGISGGAAGRLNLIADYQNNLLVGYNDSALGKGSAQKFSAGTWSYLGGSAGFTAGAALYNSFSADASGGVYFTNANSGMEVKKYSTAAWASLGNATTATINFQASAVAPNGTLYVASNENAGTVKRYVNGAWEQVGTTGFFGGTPYFLDMTIGTSGKVYISFNNNSYVHVYENSLTATATDAWVPTGGNANVAAAASSENYNSSITIDASNNLYLGYVSGSTGGNKLNAKKFNGTAWTQIGDENFSDTAVQYSSIAVSSTGTVYMAACIWLNGDTFLKNYVMAYNAATSTWAKVGTGVLSSGQASFNSLATDAIGNIYIAYADAGLSTKLVVKKLVPAVATPSVVVTTQNNAAATITTAGGTLQLVATTVPASTAVTWSVQSGSAYATISQAGLVTATANGTVTLRATQTSNTAVYGEITVTITNQPVPATAVTVSTQNSAPATITTATGTLQLMATVTPANATNAAVTWSVQSGAAYASVSQAGLVTAIANGTVTLRAALTADAAIYDDIDVVITNQFVPTTAVTVTTQNNVAATITTATGTLQLVTTVAPADATNTAVTWSVQSGSGYATVSQTGLVTAIANGTVTLRATLTTDATIYDDIDVVITNQFVPTMAVTVTTLNDTEPTITTTAGTLQLVATVIPANATNNAVTWSVQSGADYASVNQDGLITAIANGKVTLRAALTADATIFDDIEVTVAIVLSTDTFTNQLVTLYPNPVANMLTINTNSLVKNVVVFNIMGQQVFAGNSNAINLSNLIQGNYIIKVTLDNGTQVTRKIVKM